MLNPLNKSVIICVFIKNFLLAILAFIIVITIQFNYFITNFEMRFLIAPIIFSIIIGSLMGWNGILRKKLEHNNKIKNEFISNVSHELRNPISAINGFSHLIYNADGIPQVKIEDYAKKIHYAGSSLLCIISDLQDISSIESGKLQVEIKRLYLKNELHNILLMLKMQADEHGVVIKQQPFAEDLAILADSNRLQQILINLISNAIKYGRDNSQITIQTEEKAKTVRITVIDQGQGISKDKLSQVFIPFDRLGAEKTTIKGTGIGLVVTKHLIEIMHGKIGVESELGKGTQFWFELPKAK